MQKVLTISPELCTGCRLCELACSAWRYKTFNPAKARVTIFQSDEKGIDIPIVCRQCKIPLCAQACPVDAFSRNEETGAVIIDYDICINCGLCVEKCPLYGVWVEPGDGAVIKCDLCDGDPQCAKYCPTGAIRYVKLNQVGLSKRKAAAERSRKFRHKFVSQQGVKG